MAVVEEEEVYRQDLDKEVRSSPGWVAPLAGLLCEIDET